MSELDHYLQKWDLSNPVKIDVESAASIVYRVQKSGGIQAILKILVGDGIRDEKMGAVALDYFSGHGAARIYDYDKGAHLLEYIDGVMLRELVDNGRDDEASEIIANIVQKLHSIDKPRPTSLRALRENFRELFDCADNPGADPYYKVAAGIADDLFETTTKEVVLHGDIHHENILGSREKGWILIDPKGLIGDPCYDLANSLNNPPGRWDLQEDMQRVERMATIFADILGYDRDRIIKFACAYMALSSAWHYCSGNFEDNKRVLDSSKRIYQHFKL